MKITRNIGMFLLAVYLIVDGLLGFGLHLGRDFSALPSGDHRWRPDSAREMT